jgi:replication factor C subunit 1
MLISEKYKPKVSSSIIGQYYNIKSLKNWLNKWNKNSNKCVILHGPPSTGKTLCANIISKENGYYTVEYNGSDIRSKNNLEKEITENQNNKTIQSFFIKKKKIIIMEDIDSLNERGSITELVNILKKTISPIIFICNEITKELKTLSSYCLKLKFYKPKNEIIIPWIKNILTNEKIKIKSINQFIENSNYDIRQMLIKLDMKCNLNINIDTDDSDIFQNTIKLLNEKNDINLNSNLYFSDSFIMPLMIQENYIEKQNLNDICTMSDYLCIYDVIESKKHNELMPLCSILSCHSINIFRQKKNKIKKVTFSKYLGCMSKFNKNNKLFTNDFRLDRLEYYKIILFQPLILNKDIGILNIINYMKNNNISKEDRENIIDLSLIKLDIPTRLKSFTTKMINKHLT